MQLCFAHHRRFHRIVWEIVTEPARIETVWLDIVIRTGTFSGIVSQGPPAIRARARSTVTAPD